MASRLYETLNSIELGRKNCIHNAKLANLPATDNMDIYTLGNLFLQQNNDHFINPNDPSEIGTDGEHGGWTRPIDWWDTKTILSEAEAITQGGTTYYPAYIMLLADWDVSTEVTKTKTNEATYGEAFIFSDEPDTLYIGDQTHTWDISKDKPCSLGYKTRYIIVYITSKTNNTPVGLKAFKLLECIFGEFTSSNFSFYGSGSIRNRWIKNFETLDNFLSTTIGSSAFQYCYSLKSVNLPNITKINSAFQYCGSLTNVNAPNVTTINSNAFQYCYSLTNVNAPNVTTISTNAFGSCFSLTNVNAPNLTTIGDNAFQSCCALTNVNTPNLTTIGNTAFVDCASLEILTLPSTIIEVSSSILNGCKNLKVLDLPNDWNLALNISACDLTKNCMLDIISKLKDLTGEASKTFTFGTTNLANLTAAEIAVATAKNWILN